MSLFNAGNAVAFLSNNIVKCLVQNPELKHKTATGTVHVLPNESGGTIDDKPEGKIYWLEFIEPNRANDDCIEIYWVNYQGDALPPPTMIGNDANFMFTAMMSGCSLGVGSYGAAGVVGVGHANAMNSGSQKNTGLTGEAAFRQQKNIQQQMLYSKDVSKRIITYQNYMMLDGTFDNALKSTTFGIHTPGQPWTFYTLKYKQNAGQRYEHHGVHEQISGNIL